MSIPPLVCSTPPPPDQCVDDKDHQDFDLSYSLSQDDDDDEEENNRYNYGNFTPYDHFQSAPIPDPLQINDHQEKIDKSEIPKQNILKYEEVEELEQGITRHNVIGINDINENKLKSEDEINIEDLNLQVDEEIETVFERNIGQVVDIEQIVSDVKDLNIPCNSNDSLTCDITTPFEENAIIACNAPKELNSECIVLETEKPEDVHMESDPNVRHSFLNDDSISSVDEFKEFVELEETSINSRNNENPEPSSSQNVDIQLPENVEIDDDFGDFDDFQSVNIKSGFTSVVENSGNPWENDNSNEPEFENFTANFEEVKFHSENSVVVNNVSSSSKLDTIKTENECIVENNLHDDHDDDFGDFDEFKSSAIKTDSKESIEPSLSHEVPVLNLHITENEHQIMDRITAVLSTVFLEEISEPQNDFESKLESLLSETWGHLLETDERQPYIVNWNNSFGQKTLLRSLCIDSRNILFGPKWGGNMPKYAANLSNAPLQPQKQESAPSSLVTQNEAVTEKPITMPVSWSDPFTSDGQEFTYAEALLLDLEHLMATLDQMAHNHPTLKISELLSHACNTENETGVNPHASMDKDVFEPTIPIKTEKIFSNTIDIQPVRQINLPDTHIYTPTDSEIPRSKTIHYDHSANVLLPTLAGNKNQIDSQNSLGSNSANENISEVDKNEYWEFQNFKSSDSSSMQNNIDSNQTILPENTYSTLTIINALPQPSVAFQTELLQPIKIEPATPTLNWPDPGEVKEVFDDFSDFVSSSQPENKQDDSSHIKPQSVENIQPAVINVVDLKTISERTTIFHNEPNPDKDSFDDDFDTFRSALPTQSTSSHLGNAPIQINPSEYVNTVSQIDKIKSDTISNTSIARPNEALTKNVGYENTKEFTANRSSLAIGTHTQGSLLQPIPANFAAMNTQSQKKSGQILQPLSLESYSQINWPSPGIDLQDLSRFNPVETLRSLKSDLSTNGPNKGASPVHTNQVTNDDDVWGEFVSSKPKPSLSSQPKKPSAFVEDDEWSDFISSPSVKPQNGLNTISLNVHTNSNIHKSVQNKFVKKTNQPPIDIPTLNYVTPKSNTNKSYNEKHFQNL